MHTEEPISVAYIGIGDHAEQSHLALPVRPREARVVMLSGIDHAQLNDIQHRYAPAATTTLHWEDVMDNPEVQAVFIATPDELHTSQLLAAVQAQKHALVDKPLATTLDEYQLLKNGLYVANEQGLVISTCLPRQFDPPFVHTKMLLDNRDKLAQLFGLPPDTDLGEVTHFALNLNYSPPVRQKHESFALDHLPHEIDTASYFFGVSGLTRAVSHINELQQFDIEAEREDGIRLRFRGNRLQPTKGWREDWRIIFANHSQLSVHADTGIVSLNYQGARFHELPLNQAGRPVFVTDYTKRFGDLNRHFLRSVVGQETPYLSVREMLLSTVAALALRETGKPVSISADGDSTEL
jgi:predicted dehydrogenase